MKCMLPERKRINEESHAVYRYILTKRTCSFEELQHVSGLETVHLCMVLIELMQEDKIRQESKGGKVCYTLCEEGG